MESFFVFPDTKFFRKITEKVSSKKLRINSETFNVNFIFKEAVQDADLSFFRIFSRRILSKGARLLQWQVFFFFFVKPQNVCVVDTFSTELLNYWAGKRKRI